MLPVKSSFKLVTRNKVPALTKRGALINAQKEDFKPTPSAFEAQATLSPIQPDQPEAQSNQLLQTEQITQSVSSANTPKTHVSSAVATATDSKDITESSRKAVLAESVADTQKDAEVADAHRRIFLKLLGGAGLGLFALSVLPKKANALVAGSAPTSGVVGVKNAANTRINPATEESLTELLSGQGVSKATVSLSSSDAVLWPSPGKRLRIYSTRFSLSADATAVSFRFDTAGPNHERYVSPKTGGLYGANNHPNYIQGGVNQSLYCVIVGTTTVQINVDYLEV